MRGTIVLYLGCLAALSLPGTNATARLDAAPAPAQSKAPPATGSWNAFSADITIRHSRVKADGTPTGVVTPAVKHHWERRLTAAGWKSTMTLGSEPVVTVEGLNGRKRIENPFAITRIEDDEDGTPLRFFDRKGDQVRLPSEADLPRFNGTASPFPGSEASLASAVRPLSFSRDWSDALVASPERSATRRGRWSGDSANRRATSAPLIATFQPAAMKPWRFLRILSLRCRSKSMSCASRRSCRTPP